MNERTNGKIRHYGEAPMASLERLNNIDRMSTGDKVIRWMLGAMTSAVVIIVVVIGLKFAGLI